MTSPKNIVMVLPNRYERKRKKEQKRMKNKERKKRKRKKKEMKEKKEKEKKIGSKGKKVEKGSHRRIYYFRMRIYYFRMRIHYFQNAHLLFPECVSIISGMRIYSESIYMEAGLASSCDFCLFLCLQQLFSNQL